MKVTNISGSIKENVRITRYFDARLNNFSTQDRYVHALRSVWAWTVFTMDSTGLLLTSLTPNTRHGASLETLTEWDPSGFPGRGRYQCVLGQSTSGPTPHGDFVGRVFHQVGNLNPGQSRTVKVQYRLF